MLKTKSFYKLFKNTKGLFYILVFKINNYLKISEKQIWMITLCN